MDTFVMGVLVVVALELVAAVVLSNTRVACRLGLHRWEEGRIGVTTCRRCRKLGVVS